MSSRARAALAVLEISSVETELGDLSHRYIKKQYYKQALRFHPDKNDNTPESVAKFKQINEAYVYLTTDVLCEDEPLSNDDNDDGVDWGSAFFKGGRKMPYVNVLSQIIKTLIVECGSGNNGGMVFSVIKELVMNKTISSTLLATIDRGLLVEIYALLCKNQTILGISDETMDLVKSLFANDAVVILNPSIGDLWNSSVYKMHIADEVYLIPLWHSELYFDAKKGDGSELIVLCNPELPPGVSILDNNDVCITKNISTHIELFPLIRDNGFVEVIVCGKSFSIPVGALAMKRCQTYVIKGVGIPRANEKNMYSTAERSDIIVSIVLVD